MTARQNPPHRFVVFTDGDRPCLERLPDEFADAIVVAADGGARHATAMGLHVDHVIGDLDSLRPDEVRHLADAGAIIDAHPVDKDETDLELALALARDLAAGHASEVLVVGGAGGRIDHFASNLAVLAGPITSDMTLSASMGTARISVIRPGCPLHLDAAIGSLVTLLAMGGDAKGVTTSGLGYSLQDAVLRVGTARGTSNIVTASPAVIEVVRGTLLAIEPDHHNPKEPS